MSSYVIIHMKFGTKKKVEEVFEQEPVCHHECVCRAAIYTLLAVCEIYFSYICH